MRDAREALTAIDDARAQAAARLVTPWWYHPVLGLLAAGMLLLVALASLPAMAVGLALYGAGIGILAGAYKAKTGVWTSGLKAGKASAWAYLLMAIYAACVLTALGFGRIGHVSWPAWVAAALMVVATVLIGRRFDAALRAQLRSTP